VRDVLHQHRLAGARRRHDQGALALADRSDDVDHASGKIFFLVGSSSSSRKRLIGKQRRQIVEIDLVLGFLRVFKIQRVDLEQREIAFALLSGCEWWPSMVSPVEVRKRRICEGET